MDLKQLEYILEIAKTNNITKAAGNLYISQSALNQQLLKLEKELGCQLFVRSRTNWHLTEEGEAYIEGARRILQIKKDTYNRINDISTRNASELRLGLTSTRGIKMFIDIYPQLYKAFGNITFTPIDMGTRGQLAAIKEGEIDLGFFTAAKDQHGDEDYELLCPEDILFICPSILPICEKYPEPEDGSLSTVDLSDFRYEPFALMYKVSTLRQVCDRILEDSGITDPYILMYTSNTSSIPPLVASNLCVGFIPRFYFDPSDKRIRGFLLKHRPTWDLCIGYKRGAYLSSAARAYIDIAREYWRRTLGIKD